MAYNLYTYVSNNPINLSEENGTVAAVATIGLIGIGTAGLSTAGLSNVIFAAAVIAIGITARHFTAKSMNNIISTAKAINASDAQIRKTITKKSSTRYWSASLNPGYVTLGQKLTYGQAIKEVRAGRNVFAVTRTEAEMVAQIAGGDKKPVLEYKHKNSIGYYNHFHMSGHKGGHVWYLF